MKSSKITSWTLERYLLGELSQEENQKIQEMINIDPDLHQKILNMQKSSAEFWQKQPLGRQIEQIQSKLDYELAHTTIPFTQNKSSSTKWWASAAAAMLVLFGVALWGDKDLNPSQPNTQVTRLNHEPQIQITPKPASPKSDTQAIETSLIEKVKTKKDQIIREIENQVAPQNNQVALLEEPEAAIRSKGKLTLELWQALGDSAVQIENRAKLKPGNLLQIKVTPQKIGFMAVYSIDGRGQWTTHTDQVMQISKLGQRTLGHSYELDDAPNFELFCVLFTPKQFNTQDLLSVLKNKNPHITSNSNILKIPSSFKQTCQVVLK